MRKFFATLLKMTIAFVIGAAFTVLTIESTQRSIELNRISEIQSLDNVSLNLSPRTQRTLRTSRNSAVQIMSASMESPVISSSSGTYIKLEDRYYILTVGHAIIGPCEMMRIMVDDEMHHCLEYARIDRFVDYAIIEVEQIPNRTPVKIPDAMPEPDEWVRSLSIHTNVYYTGFPNGLGPLSMNGIIVGYDVVENVYIQSFAWPGSSGSGVFNENGKLIGFVMAISVGATEYGISVLEDLAIVVPLYQIDWDIPEPEGEEDNEP